MPTFLVFQVEVNEEDVPIDTWSTWSPVAALEAASGAQAIEKLAEDPAKVGHGALLAAVPQEEVIVRTTTLHRHATVHEAASDLIALAPELVETATSEA